MKHSMKQVEGKSMPTWADQERLHEGSGHLVTGIQMILVIMLVLTLSSSGTLS